MTNYQNTLTSFSRSPMNAYEVCAEEFDLSVARVRQIANKIKGA